ncbi:MAG: hypothetical protein RsTaC01_0257 [Candidatus Paraimprobicoccus trichonymphae]|uniref:Uncharacterized protein n=1 Tax=Candidatus Paraimprobicoccus trichonymphae TaxID=3033793 RepID=A0AA48HZB5_9FIRM|nr:MAG: hypothetical protein RsTaC01_0257 [Candidatus Paraimprobicoccus trichonymphae]
MKKIYVYLFILLIILSIFLIFFFINKNRSDFDIPNFNQEDMKNLTVIQGKNKYKLETNIDIISFIKFLEPKNLKNLIFTFEDNKIKISKDKLDYEMENKNLDKLSFVNCIFQIFNILRNPKDFLINSSKINNKTIMILKSDFGNFEVTLDNKNIEKISIPEKNIEIITILTSYD